MNEKAPFVSKSFWFDLRKDKLHFSYNLLCVDAILGLGLDSLHVCYVFTIRKN